MEMQKNFAKIKNFLKDIQWRWIFGATFAVSGLTQLIMFFLISIFVARSSAAGNTLDQVEISQISEMLGNRAGPFVFLGLAFAASLWMAIKVRIALHAHGWILGIILAAISWTLDAAFSTSLELVEFLSTMLVIPVAWLGAYRGENILNNREAVYRTSQALSGRDKLGLLAAVGEQLAGPAVIWIALADGSGNLDAASAWKSQPKVRVPPSIPMKRSQFQRAAPLKADDLSENFSAIRSLLVLPLSDVDQVLVVATRNRSGFTRTETQNYETIGEQISLSLKNWQLLEEARQTGVTQERHRLAAEIHDSLTQGFVSIVTHLEVAEAKMEKQPPGVQADFRELLNQVRQTARDNLTAARKMTWALRPDLAEGMPLPNALEKLAEEWSGTSHIQVNFSLSGDARQLHPDITTVLLRTLREALNNIMKHAEATQVRTTLTYLDTLVALDVQDNGKGFDFVDRLSAEGGFGLKSLQAQAERLGGELSIESEVGHGCTVAISIPTG